MAILQDPNPDVPRIDRSKQGVVALASIAAAAHKRGDRKSSQAIMKELCGMAERAWASSIEDHVDPFLFRSIAVEFARGGDQEALRVIARHAFSVSRPDNIKNLGHLISQLQESIGDRGGAEQTLRWSRWYSPEMEIAHWSALARAIESVDLFVGDPTSRPDVLQESSKMSKAATVLLRTQQQLQFTSTLWRKVPRQTWRAG